ncbi:MAG: hypothetical protein NTY67_02670 [Cyanobacteria bacterium]|nr:hypothetical protein [Cyanobacteriota bacterium]
MDSRQEPLQQEPRTFQLVDLLGPAASANLLIYIGAVAAGALPLALLNPFWQLRFIALLVDNGGYALMGFVLIHLAVWFDPEDRRLGLRCNQARSLAVAVTLGFLLLIPLQPWATWNSMAGEVRLQAQERRVVEQQFSSWKRALNRATDVQNLRTRFRALSGPAIGEAESRLPWPQLRQQLLVGLVKARADALSAHAGPSNVQIWGVVQESLRRMVAAFALALAFAAGAQLPGEQRSLLGWWLASSQERQGRRAMRIQQRRLQKEQRQRLRQTLRAMEQSRQEQPLASPAQSTGSGLLPSFQYNFRFAEVAETAQRAALADVAAAGRGQEPGGGDGLGLASLEDPTLLLTIRSAPAGSAPNGSAPNAAVALFFNRSVRLAAFTVAEQSLSGRKSSIGFRCGDNHSLQGPYAWVGGFRYTLDQPLLLELDEPLWLEGAAPQGLIPPTGTAEPCVPLAEITVVEPPPSLRMALQEELESWRRRLPRWAAGRAAPESAPRGVAAERRGPSGDME